MANVAAPLLRGRRATPANHGVRRAKGTLIMPKPQRCRAQLFALLLGLIGYQAALHADQARPLVIAWDHRPPYQWLAESGEVTGVDVDIARAVLDRAGFSYEFVNVPWKRLLKVSLRNGDVDIGLQASKTPEREKFAYFSAIPFIKSDASLFTRVDNRHRFADVDDLEDLLAMDVKIGVTNGTVYSAQYEALLKNPQFEKKLVYGTLSEQNISMLLSHRVDALIGGNLAITHLLKVRGEQRRARHLIFINDRSDNSTGGFFIFSKTSMSRKNIDIINTALIEMDADGSLVKIVDKYR